MSEHNPAFAIHNPDDKPVNSLPTIYGFNNSGDNGGNFNQGVLIAQDGTCLGTHLCSNEGFMLGDLGIIKKTRSDRHEEFKAHYPTGYKMDSVRSNDVAEHEALNKAIELNTRIAEKENNK